MAFTAAVWSLNRITGDCECTFQIKSLLSFPPDASCWSSHDHLSPHTSCLCPTNFDTKCCCARTSRWKIRRSLEPLANVWWFQAIVPTRPEWPSIMRTFLHLAASHICTSPALVPTARCVPRCVHDTDVTRSSFPRSHSFVTCARTGVCVCVREDMHERT